MLHVSNTIDPMSIQPVNNRVLLKLSKRKTRTEGGLYIPDCHKGLKRQVDHISVWHTGEVIAKGPGKLNPKNGNRIPSDIKIGQKGLFQYCRPDWEIVATDNEDNKYVMVNGDDLFCAVQEL